MLTECASTCNALEIVEVDGCQLLGHSRMWGAALTAKPQFALTLNRASPLQEGDQLSDSLNEMVEPFMYISFVFIP
jgi:hypothetical protein